MWSGITALCYFCFTVFSAWIFVPKIAVWRMDFQHHIFYKGCMTRGNPDERVSLYQKMKSFLWLSILQASTCILLTRPRHMSTPRWRVAKKKEIVEMVEFGQSKGLDLICALTFTFALFLKSQLLFTRASNRVAMT